jgi:predicted MFS family arabinose efflux permease
MIPLMVCASLMTFMSCFNFSNWYVGKTSRRKRIMWIVSALALLVVAIALGGFFTGYTPAFLQILAGIITAISLLFTAWETYALHREGKEDPSDSISEVFPP